MSISDRQNEIIKLLEENRFMTVNDIADKTFTSPSSIRRDLNRLQEKHIVKRSYGGATLYENIGIVPSFDKRIQKNVAEKRIIAKKASVLLHDNQSILLDGSSTVHYLIPYIAQYKDIKLFTNNLLTAMKSIESGIETHCIGGKSVNNSAVLASSETYDAISKINPDILFFSAQAIDNKGLISDSLSEENELRKLMIKQCETTVFLADSEKFGNKLLYSLIGLDEIDYAVFDKDFCKLETKCEII